jgi:hypothetical protein
MFIKNFSSINKNNIISVDEATKSYLMSCGYFPLSLNKDKWIFRKTTDLLNILMSIEEGGEKVGR